MNEMIGVAGKKCKGSVHRREFIQRSAVGPLGLAEGPHALASNDKVRGEIPVQKAKHVSNPSDAAWYVFTPGIGYARRWIGEPLAAPPVEDPDKAKLGALLGDFAGDFLDEMTGAGALRFSSLWCGGRTRALLAPKPRTWLEWITAKKRQFENLERTAQEWAVGRYAEVATEWQRFRPAGHMLVMEAQPVYLRDKEAEMQAEAREVFRDAYRQRDLRPELVEATEPTEDDPNRWYVIIG